VATAPELRRLPSDEAERAVARGDLGRSHVVEAGAGTGKTTVLVDRVLALIRTGAAPLDRIVAITFTEKAAGELKARLRDALERALASSADPAAGEAARLAAAVADLERAPIETIHAFAARLLRDRPVEAGVDPRFETLDELRSDLLFEQTWSAWLDQTLARAPTALRHGFATGLERKVWLELAQRLVATRTSRTRREPREPHQPEPPLPDAVAWIRAAELKLQVLHRELARAARDDRDRLLVKIGETLAALAPWPASGDSIAALSYCLRDLSLPPDSAGRKSNYPPGVLDRARAELTDLGRALEAFRAAAGEALLRPLLDCLEGFVDRFEATKRDRGQLDFDDLLLQARDLLATHPEARRAFAQRYRFLLVDEFQDTDPLQAEIVFLLCDEAGVASDWRSVEVPPGKLFLVGDPKQSIYRFRRADVELYEDAKQRLLDGGRPVVAIRENFRSDAGLIDWVNAVFLGEMRPPDDGFYQPDYRPLTPYHRDARGAHAITVLLPAAGTIASCRTAPERREREADAIAALLNRARAEGWPVRGGDENPRPVQFGDMALLLRAMPDIEIYEEALRRAGVPYRITGGKDYYRRAEVQALLRLLEAVDDPADEIAVVAALRSPIFGVADDVLRAHRAGGGRFDYLVAAGHSGAPPPEVADAFACLRELRAERNRLDPPALIRAALERTRALAAVAVKPHGEQRVANLLKLADEAQALGDAGLRSLRGVVRWLADLESREIDESESPLAEDGDDAVRVMTVHKAKGLEFRFVVLADVGREGKNDRPPLLVERASGAIEARAKLAASDAHVTTLGYERLWEHERARLDAESLRLLYVATTRARDILVLPLFTAKEGDGSRRHPFLRALEGHLPGLGVAVPGGLAERVFVVDAATLPPPPPRAVLQRLKPPFEGGEPAAARLAKRRAWESERRAALDRASKGVALLLPSKLVEAASFRFGEIESGDRSRGAGAPGAGIRAGIAVHAALEGIDLADRTAAVAAGREQARLQGLAGVGAARVERLTLAALAAPVTREALAARSYAREVPFATRIGEALVEGVADLVFEARSAGGLTIADWKTDAGAREGARAIADLALGYRPQALLYALALEKAAAVPVREVVLVFLDGRSGAEEVRIVFDRRAREEAAGLASLDRTSRPRPTRPVNLSLFGEPD
jgi:ATP-dependent helicase/nuclease subunit A